MIAPGTVKVESYVGVLLLADYLQAETWLMRGLQNLDCAVDAVLQQKELILSHAPNLLGVALASRVFMKTARVDQLDMLKWIMRGGSIVQAASMAVG
ncbi:hypothetical protein WJX73_004012 [Symbiochloris irregularis]|uniref:Uncharacterized protein n=1 Tax=Symbiochloris irregularis TaxID=706552 RepID=A0AAW1P113_9CHLO